MTEQPLSSASPIMQSVPVYTNSDVFLCLLHIKKWSEKCIHMCSLHLFCVLLFCLSETEEREVVSEEPEVGHLIQRPSALVLFFHTWKAHSFHSQSEDSLGLLSPYLFTAMSISKAICLLPSRIDCKLPRQVFRSLWQEQNVAKRHRRLHSFVFVCVFVCVWELFPWLALTMAVCCSEEEV